MLSLNKSTKTIDIEIVDEKFYFPSQTIKGFVHILPKSATKTNNITIKFTGEISLSMKEKDTINLFEETKVIDINSDSDNVQAKFCILESKPYSFPFEFVVPSDMHLPSTMEFNKKIKVRYTLTALHDKYMVPESLCPKIEYPIRVLELIDINDIKYKEPMAQCSEMFLPRSNPMNRCSVAVALPRKGFTRGDIIPLSMIVQHYQPFHLPQAIDISLIRSVEIRNSKTTQVKEDILKSVQCDIEINGAPGFSQTVKRQLMIPTSTPPTINFKNKLMRIQYHVRVCAQLISPSSNQQRDSKKSPQDGSCKVDIPITVGTWPRASIPIDDDDGDDDDIRSDINYEDTDFIELTNSISGSENNTNNDCSSVISDDRKSTSTWLSQQQHPRSDRLPSTPTRETFLSNSSSSAIMLTAKSSPSSPITASNDLIGRSDSLASKSSNKSHASHSSCRSSQSWDNSSGSLSRNTSLSTTVSLHESCSNTAAIAVNLSSPTTDTIIMTSAPAINNTITTNRSDTTVFFTQSAPASHHSRSFSENDRLQHNSQYPVFIGPSPLKYRQQPATLSPLQSSSGISSTPSNNLSSSPSSSNITLLTSSPLPSTPTSSSFYHHRSSSSLSISSNDQSLPPPIFKSSPSAILLQPVNANVKKDAGTSQVPQTNPVYASSTRPSTTSTSTSTNNYDDDDDDDDDDDEDDDDFLTIIKRKQERNLLAEETRLQVSEMKI
ncbi:hypothetical protein [Absidia glauca]|uniref:Arrestin C-terminal-like domain-containing protein n=1 Tax=Absidia glauca TaxID=4829 RepID=A0A168QXF7_ABSGL|nr:hypothetical protein [Absidia glauca]